MALGGSRHADLEDEVTDEGPSGGVYWTKDVTRGLSDSKAER